MDAEREVRLLSNDDLARIFHEIGDILEVQGELVFKTVAYHRAADAIARSPVEVARAYREGRPPRIEGVGKAISDKLAELATTGHLAFHDRLTASFPTGLLGLLRVPGVGPRTVRLLHEVAGVDTLEDLRRAAEAGRLRSIRGLSERSEASILAGIEALETRQSRMLLGAAEAHVRVLVEQLSAVPGVTRVEPAGSWRRRKETIGDLDLLVETDAPDALLDVFTTLPQVAEVIARGRARAAVRLSFGPQVDLMIMPPGAAGTYLVHFTGAAAHNVRLRGRARDRGWSLSERGFLPLGPDGEPVPGAVARTFASEAEAYAFLDLAFIPPELREDRGEVAAAAEGRLPRLIEAADLRGDLHCHTDWSDGIHPIEAMAEAARARGLSYVVITDHSRSLAIARGLAPERVEAQRAIIAELNARYAGSFRVLHGCELELRADASLDFDDDLLARFDVVVASLHVARRQPREQLMARVMAALRSPHVDVIAHPAGRMIQGRDDLDLDWPAVFAEAARTGTALEMNGSDHRLDLSDERARAAVEAGCRLALDSDAHRAEELVNLDWAVSQARRAWVEPGVVLNAMPLAELLAWVAAKADRLRA